MIIRIFRAAITKPLDTELYVTVVTLSTNDNVKLLDQLKCDFKRTINWNKYQSKETIQQQNSYLDYLIYPRFQGVIRLFVLSFPDMVIPSLEMKDYNVIIDGQKLFNQSVRTKNKLFKIISVQGNDYRTCCLLFYPYFNEHYKMIAIDLSKKQALNADPKVMQLVNFTGNLDRAGNTTVFSIIEEAKEIILDFSQGTVIVL